MTDRENRDQGHEAGRGEPEHDERDHADRDHGNEGGRPIVQVLDSNTNREVKFHMQWTDTLQAVWDRAYTELGEAKVEGDEFSCQDGPVLTAHLSLTLAEARDRHICPARKFAIMRPTGGASA